MQSSESPTTDENPPNLSRSWASLTDAEIGPPTTSPANHSISILRFFIWLSPAAFIFGYLIAVSFLSSFGLATGKNLAIWIFILIVMTVTCLLGYLDKRLSLMKNRIAPPHNKSDIAGSIAIFLIMQLIITPAVFVVLFIGLFMIAK